jgi:tetratricopeptide (TPR) repeat protein
MFATWPVTACRILECRVAELDMGDALQVGRPAVSRLPWRWTRRVILWAIPALTLIGVAVLVAKLVLFPRRDLDCAAAYRNGAMGVAVVVCQREYEQAREPSVGILFADALRRSGNRVAAGALATELLSGQAQADALSVLGRIAHTEGRLDDATSLLQHARSLHRDGGKRVELAKDDLGLAEVHTQREEYADSLQMLDECIGEAHSGDDERIEGYCHLTAARALMNVGYFDAASQEIDRATQQLSEPRDLAEVWYWRGNLEQEYERDPRHHQHGERAVADFGHSLDFAQRAQITTRTINIHMNLAFSLAELKRTDEADRHLADAGALDRDGRYASQRAQLAARIAYRRGNLTLASSLNEQVYPKIEGHDEQIDVCVMQARVALATGDFATAALWARRGVDAAEKVRAAQVLSELRPWVLASRREPFEVLFTVLARAGRVEEAVGVFDQWQGRTLLDEMARPSLDPSLGLSSTAARIQSLNRWLPAVSKAPLVMSDDRTVIQVMSKTDILALAVAEGDVWRLAASHGRLRLDNLGPFAKLRDQLRDFMAAPTAPALAGELGALILPGDLVRKTDEPLYVVLDALLGDLPFVALRVNGQPVIAMRPVLRTPRLPTLGACRPHLGITPAHVLADARGNLPDAREESSQIASRFGTTPLLGADATSTALFAARADPLLHVAVHAGFDSGGGTLKLYDRDVSALEISANKLGPELVVLSGCNTARSWDPELASSLSTAFLAGGSRRVVATLRSVSDTGASQVTSRFYGAGGAEDPVRVLATIQATLAQSGNQDWPYFAVFGSEVCTRGS